MLIKIKQKQWMHKRIESGVTWTGAIDLGLFNLVLKKLNYQNQNFHKLNSNK